MREIVGVLCDLDGTLVDSEWLHVMAWDEIARRYSLDLPEGWDDDYVGKPDSYQAEKMRVVFPFLPEKDKLLGERHTIYQGLLRSNSAKVRFPGVEDSLKTLRDAGFKLALGSNSHMGNCQAALEAAGLLDYFPVIVAFGMVKEGKPAPDIYLEAAKRLGLDPAACAVIEDTALGIASGRAAGCLTLGVATTTTPDKLKDADRVFPTTAAALDWIAESNLAVRRA